MADDEQPDWTATDDHLKADPDMPEQPDEAGGPDSMLPSADDTPIGETDRIAEEKAAYGASSDTVHSDHGHAVGGSERTADGQ